VVLRAITIENFRGFERFEMHGLGRVNLLVGTNNCGKTSVLEAIHILVNHANPSSLRTILARRGERSRQEVERQPRMEVRHLFRGHSVEPDTWFEIVGDSGVRSEMLRVAIARRDPSQTRSRSEQLALPIDSNDPTANESSDDMSGGQLGLLVRWSGKTTGGAALRLDGGGVMLAREYDEWPIDGERSPIRFITTESMGAGQIIRFYESIALTPEEELVLEALRTVEPAIDRIAPLGLTGGLYGTDRGGLVVRLKGSHSRVPIGSMGDGVWRLLGIALNLIQAKDGILLVDEIDTGLHFTVMADMWKLVLATAKRLDVQVFATTHSRDCYESLAAISRANVGEGSEVSIQRIEKGRPKAVAFTEQEIVIAAERGIEVR
jgi:hypothetical protein